MESGILLHGVEVNGQVHYDFTVSLPVVRDTIEALRQTDDACGTTDGAAAGMYYKVAVMASALQSLGDIPKESITPDMLLDGLSDDDFDLIDAQIDAIKKKRMGSNPKFKDIVSPSSPSVDTDSAQNTSEQ